MPPTRKPHQSLPAQSLSLSSLFSALSIFSRSASLHSFFPLAASSRFSPSFLHCFFSYSSHSLLSLSTRLVSSFLPNYECRCVSRQSRATHTRPLSPSSSLFSHLSPLFASPLCPCLSFPLLLSFFCLYPFSRLSRSLLSPHSSRLLLFLFLLPLVSVGASPSIRRHLLGSELRGRRTRHLQRHAFCSQTAKPPGVAGGECASPAVKNLDVTLVPQAARLQRTVEAALCELPAPSAHRSFLFPCYVPLFCSVFLLVLRSLMMMMMTFASNLVHYASWPFARNHDTAENGTHWPRNSKNADLPQS